MLVIGNKIYRNLQEQVAANQSDIIELKEILEGTEVENRVIIEDRSGLYIPYNTPTLWHKDEY